MRLTKPSLMSFHPLITDDRDVLGKQFEHLNTSDIGKPEGLDYFGVGDLLTLPQNFG
jgi:hypothetical protein